MRLQRYRKSTPNGVDFLSKYVGLLLISSIFLSDELQSNTVLSYLFNGIMAKLKVLSP